MPKTPKTPRGGSRSTRRSSSRKRASVSTTKGKKGARSAAKATYDESDSEEETVERSEARMAAPAPSPARVSRTEEKVELRNLNTRLASYVMRSKAMEDDVTMLQRQLEAETEENRQLELQVSSLDLTIHTLRAQLKDMPALRKERQELQMRISRMEEEHGRQVMELETELREEQSRSASYSEQVESLEAEVKKLRDRLQKTSGFEKEVGTLKRRIETLEEERETAVSQLESVQQALDDLRDSQQGSDEAIAEAEARAEVLEEENKRLKHQVDDLTQSKKAAVAQARKAGQKKLAEQRQQWKEESDARAAAIEEELRDAFTESSQQLKERGETLRQQNSRLQEEMDALVDELTKANAEIKERVAELQASRSSHSEESQVWAMERSRLEKEVSSLHEAHAQKIDEFNDLMDVKVSLQAEIEQYRAILEGEEARLGVGGDTSVFANVKRSNVVADSEGEEDDSPAGAGAGAGEASDDDEDDSDDEAAAKKTRRGGRRSTRKSTRKQTRSSARVTRSAKRARVEASSSDVAQAAAAASAASRRDAAASSGVKLDNVDLVSDCVSIKNFTSEPQPMKGWVLKSAVGNQVFRFPDDLVLPPGKRVTVWSGKTAHRHHKPPFNLFWTRRFIWNNDGDTAVLLNSDNLEVSRITSAPGSGTGQSQDDTDEDDGSPAEEGDGSCIVM